jgi:hypothetical protein
VTVAADDDLHFGPACPDGLDQVPEHAGDLGTVGRLARPEDHRHGLAGRGLVDVDREKAAAVVMRMEQRQLLTAVHPVLGVVDIEQNASRHLGKAVAEQIDHRIHHADERGLRRQILQAAHRGLRAELGPRLGQAAHRYFERRIVAQGIAVVGVRVVGGDQQRPETDHLGETVPHPLGCSRIGDAARQSLGDPELALDLGQQQHAGIRGHPPAVEGELNRLARNG